jgi:hypothetical protein
MHPSMPGKPLSSAMASNRVVTFRFSALKYPSSKSSTTDMTSLLILSIAVLSLMQTYLWYPRLLHYIAYEML